MTRHVWGLIFLLVLMGVEVCTRGRVLRTLWKEAIRAGILLDLACVRLLQRIIRPGYVLQGACDKRGVCCQHIIGDPPRAIKDRPRLLSLYARYHAVAHRFSVVARGPNDELIFSCGHLKSDGRCGIYRYRPRLCRNYPVVPFFGPPRVLPGCGYKIAARSVAAMQPRKSLPILNAVPAIHHPTPPQRPQGDLERPEDYHCVDV